MCSHMLHCYGDTLQHITVNHDNRVLQQTKIVQWLMDTSCQQPNAKYLTQSSDFKM